LLGQFFTERLAMKALGFPSDTPQSASHFATERYGSGVLLQYCQY
jgi:hypothetical protein